MNKRRIAYSIFGILNTDNMNSNPTFLGIAENMQEEEDIMNEYINVFGRNQIEFHSERTPNIYLTALRIDAFKNLFASLNGPVKKVIIGLQTTTL